MTVSTYDVHAEFFALIEDRETEFCQQQLAIALEGFQTVIAKLEAQASAYQDSKQADFKDCDRAQRIANQSKFVLRLIEGREVALPRF